MMNLQTYYGKNVTVFTTDGQAFTGRVDDYFYPEDNENGEESIVLNTVAREFIEFSGSEVVKIVLN